MTERLEIHDPSSPCTTTRSRLTVTLLQIIPLEPTGARTLLASQDVRSGVPDDIILGRENPSVSLGAEDYPLDLICGNSSKGMLRIDDTRLSGPHRTRTCLL